MYSATHESVTVTLPVGREIKILTLKRTNQIAGFVTVPSEKKNNESYLSLGDQTSSEKNKLLVLMIPF